MKNFILRINGSLMIDLLSLSNLFLNPKNIISFLILCAPFTLGDDTTILTIHSIYASWVAIILLFLFNFDRIIFNEKILKENFKLPIALFAISFFLSLFLGMDYTNNPYLASTSDFTFSYTIKWVTIFVITQLILIYLIYISIEEISDLKYLIKMYLLSGLVVNLIAIYTIIIGLYGADDRLISTFKNPNYLGRFEVSIVVVSVTSLIFIRVSSMKKFLLTLNIFFCIALMFLTYSRAALLTLPIVLLILSFFYKSKYFKYVLMSSIFIIFSFLIIKAASVRLGESDLNLISSILDTSNVMRLLANYAGFMFFLENPLFGIGYHNYYYTFLNSEYYHVLIWRVEYIHSWLFSLLAEQGILGFCSFFWILILVFKGLLKNIKLSVTEELRWVGITLLSLLSVLLVNALFTPTFFPELSFALFSGLIGGYFKVCSKFQKK